MPTVIAESDGLKGACLMVNGARTNRCLITAPLGNVNGAATFKTMVALSLVTDWSGDRVFT